MKITHERVNTGLALVGITIALITAWHQLGPNPDLLSIDDDGRVSVVERLTVTAVDFPSPGSSLVGPVAWKLIAYNPLDRPVAVRSVELFMLNGGGMSRYSGMLQGIGDGAGSVVNFPVNLDSRQATPFTVFLNIPLRAENNDNATPCLQSESTLVELERCLFRRGRDLFGNEVEVLVGQEDKQAPLAVTWKGSVDSPSFVVVFTTADGSEFPHLFRYYPNFERL